MASLSASVPLSQFDIFLLCVCLVLRTPVCVVPVAYCVFESMC
jgi:hypothetical protein